MNASGMNKSDKIGELWAELQKTEERLRTVGGGVSAPTMDCFVNDLPKDPFDATVFTALSDADVKARIGAAQPAVAAMVAAVVADIDGKQGGALSTLFARGGAQLSPMAVVEGPHSNWTAGIPGQVAGSASAKSAVAQSSPREQLAQTAADAKRRAQSRGRLKSASDALSAGYDDPAAHAQSDAPKAKRGALLSSTDALHSSVGPELEPIKAGPDLGPQVFENSAVPEPRAHRDLPTAVRASANGKIQPLKKKRPLWLRILWG